MPARVAPRHVYKKLRTCSAKRSRTPSGACRRCSTARSSVWSRTAAATSIGCCSGATGRTSMAFDLLAVDGEDLRDRPLLERKRRLRAIMPRIESRLLYVDHVAAGASRSSARPARVTSRGSSGSGRSGRYERDGVSTSWVKVEERRLLADGIGRRELFEARRDQRQARRQGLARADDSHPPRIVGRVTRACHACDPQKLYARSLTRPVAQDSIRDGPPRIGFATTRQPTGSIWPFDLPTRPSTADPSGIPGPNLAWGRPRL